MPAFLEHFVEALSPAAILFFSLALTLLVYIVPIVQGYPKQHNSPKIFTWRLLIRTNVNTKPRGFTIEALTDALHKRFDISLTGSRLTLQEQFEEYCAIITLRAPKAPFFVGQDFNLQLDLAENEQISLK